MNDDRALLEAYDGLGASDDFQELPEGNPRAIARLGEQAKSSAVALRDPDDTWRSPPPAATPPAPIDATERARELAEIAATFYASQPALAAPPAPASGNPLIALAEEIGAALAAETKQRQAEITELRQQIARQQLAIEKLIVNSASADREALSGAKQLIGDVHRELQRSSAEIAATLEEIREAVNLGPARRTAAARIN